MKSDAIIIKRHDTEGKTRDDEIQTRTIRREES